MSLDCLSDDEIILVLGELRMIGSTDCCCIVTSCIDTV
jgi:hypothetical protein